jgi:hypothetical protein
MMRRLCPSCNKRKEVFVKVHNSKYQYEADYCADCTIILAKHGKMRIIDHLQNDIWGIEVD